MKKILITLSVALATLAFGPAAFAHGDEAHGDMPHEELSASPAPGAAVQAEDNATEGDAEVEGATEETDIDPLLYAASAVLLGIVLICLAELSGRRGKAKRKKK